MSRTIVYYDTGGDSTASDALRVKIYRGVGISDSLFSDCHDDTTLAMDQVDNNSTDIPGYRVRSYHCNFDRTNYPNKNFINAWKTWLEDNGYTGRASHMVVHDQSSGAIGTSAGSNAWDGFSYGHARAGSSSKATIDTLIHEISHQYVKKSEVSDLINDGEHDLGKNIEKYDGGLSYLAESPLGGQCSTNEGSCKRNCSGGCSGSTCHSTWTEELTTCTVTGYERTHNYYY